MRQVEQVSYAGIDEALLVLMLYQATEAVGMGRLHDRKRTTLDEVRSELERLKTVERWRSSAWVGDSLRIDYLWGRPFKIELDTREKVLHDPHEFDLRARETAASIIAKLRAQESP